MKPRNWYRLTGGTALAGIAFVGLDGAIHNWPALGVTALATGVNGGVAWWWRQRIPHDEPVRPGAKHDRCLAEIVRLERELAADGVLFLMSQAQLDAAVDRATRGPCPWCKGQPHAVLEQCPQFVPPMPATWKARAERSVETRRGPVYTMEQWLDSLPRPGKDN